MPNSTAPSAISPMAGAAWPNPTNVVIVFAYLRTGPRVNAMPSGIATAHVSTVAATLIAMCCPRRTSRFDIPNERFSDADTSARLTYASETVTATMHANGCSNCLAASARRLAVAGADCAAPVAVMVDAVIWDTPIAPRPASRPSRP
ncbi:Uncharacterised protein [Mycobacteroides abscessus subsp. abscessus]|nr:Uncharacterised protein [Mycobacteroides abscessus subsp. abscessus]